MANDMQRSKAYFILERFWATATDEEREALRIAQNDIQFVDLMPDDMVVVCKCRDCNHITPVEGGLPLCTLHNIACAYNDYCSFGERKEE